MNKSILLLAFLFFASCAKDSSPSSAAAKVTGPVTLLCAGDIAGKSWKDINPALARFYNMNSNCTGSIPHCNGAFNYDVTNSDQTGRKGLMKIWVLNSSEDQAQACPAANSYSECAFEITAVGNPATDRLMMTCNGNFVMGFTMNGVL